MAWEGGEEESLSDDMYVCRGHEDKLNVFYWEKIIKSEPEGMEEDLEAKKFDEQISVGWSKKTVFIG